MAAGGIGSLAAGARDLLQCSWLVGSTAAECGSAGWGDTFGAPMLDSTGVQLRLAGGSPISSGRPCHREPLLSAPLIHRSASRMVVASQRPTSAVVALPIPTGDKDDAAAAASGVDDEGYSDASAVAASSPDSDADVTRASSCAEEGKVETSMAAALGGRGEALCSPTGFRKTEKAESTQSKRDRREREKVRPDLELAHTARGTYTRTGRGGRGGAADGD